MSDSVLCVLEESKLCLAGCAMEEAIEERRSGWAGIAPGGGQEEHTHKGLLPPARHPQIVSPAGHYTFKT